MFRSDEGKISLFQKLNNRNPSKREPSFREIGGASRLVAFFYYGFYHKSLIHQLLGITKLFFKFCVFNSLCIIIAKLPVKMNTATFN